MTILGITSLSLITSSFGFVLSAEEVSLMIYFGICLVTICCAIIIDTNHRVYDRYCLIIVCERNRIG